MNQLSLGFVCALERRKRSSLLKVMLGEPRRSWEDVAKAVPWELLAPFAGGGQRG